MSKKQIGDSDPNESPGEAPGCAKGLAISMDPQISSCWVYPLEFSYITIERSTIFSMRKFTLEIAIANSYVSLPEGNGEDLMGQTNYIELFLAMVNCFFSWDKRIGATAPRIDSHLDGASELFDYIDWVPIRDRKLTKYRTNMAG